MTPAPSDRIAIVLLNARGMSVARTIQAAWPGAQIHGLQSRVHDADHTFSDTRTCFQNLYTAGIPIVAICAAGIATRNLAPFLSNKRNEPPVLVMSDDGAVVVPLLGGLTGANELAHAIASVTEGTAAITASGARAFGLQLEAPPAGYTLANPDAAKRVTSDLLSGKTARLEGEAEFLTNSALPFEPEGDIPFRVTCDIVSDNHEGLIYHPRTIAVHLKSMELAALSHARTNIDHLLETNLGIATGALGAILLTEGTNLDATASSELQKLADSYDVPLRYIQNTSGLTSRETSSDMEVFEAPTSDALATIGRPHGTLAVVGLGPGEPGFMTHDATETLDRAQHIVGYETYVKLVPRIREDQTTHMSGNRVEIERAEEALDLAAEGQRVALVTSGDPGIFAMASAVAEALAAKPGRWTGLDVTIIPGVSAIQTAAARLGAPIGHDFCTISLSDIRKPWEIVEKRLRTAATADFVIALYNPASKTRREQIHSAKAALLDVQNAKTVVMLGRNLGRPGESVEITTLDAFDPDTIDMRTVLIIGSSRTRVFTAPGGKPMVYTPRTYDLD